MQPVDLEDRVAGLRAARARRRRCARPSTFASRFVHRARGGGCSIEIDLVDARPLRREAPTRRAGRPARPSRARRPRARPRSSLRPHLGEISVAASCKYFATGSPKACLRAPARSASSSVSPVAVSGAVPPSSGAHRARPRARVSRRRRPQRTRGRNARAAPSTHVASFFPMRSAAGHDVPCDISAQQRRRVRVDRGPGVASGRGPMAVRVDPIAHAPASPRSEDALARTRARASLPSRSPRASRTSATLACPSAGATRGPGLRPRPRLPAIGAATVGPKERRYGRAGLVGDAKPTDEPPTTPPEHDAARMRISHSNAAA